MTIHKSQGQTMKKIAVWLQQPVFGHGMLYVVSSRVGNPEDIKFFTKSIDGHPYNITRNVVYRELLE